MKAISMGLVAYVAVSHFNIEVALLIVFGFSILINSLEQQAR